MTEMHLSGSADVNDLSWISVVCHNPFNPTLLIDGALHGAQILRSANRASTPHGAQCVAGFLA